MKPRVEIITNKENWNRLAEQYPKANFLQSWNWGVFQEKLGKTVYRLAVTTHLPKAKAVATVVIERAKRGDYTAIYGGPLLDWNNEKLVKTFFQAVTDIAQKHYCTFIRFRPQVQDTPAVRQMAERVAARPAPMHLTADLTLQLDLNQTEDELLSQMRKNHRYYIRRAEREGITIEVSQNSADIKEFCRWQEYLAEKHGFVPFSYQFLHKQFAVFAEDNQAFLVHAYQDETLLASTFIVTFNGEAVYHYGISTPANDKLPGSYAALWRSILEAKKRDCNTFNFWGIAPEDEPDHRFAGVSLFKRGFGGEEVAYLPAHDIPLSYRYWATYLFELYRKKVRGL